MCFYELHTRDLNNFTTAPKQWLLLNKSLLELIYFLIIGRILLNLQVLNQLYNLFIISN